MNKLVKAENLVMSLMLALKVQFAGSFYGQRKGDESRSYEEGLTRTLTLDIGNDDVFFTVRLWKDYMGESMLEVIIEGDDVRYHGDEDYTEDEFILSVKYMLESLGYFLPEDFPFSFPE